MKKQLFLLPLLTLASLGLSGCKLDKRVRLTYGTLVDTEAQEIVYGTLASKISRGENFFVAVYQDGLPCGCWTTFKEVLNQYVTEYDTKMYYIARSQFSEDTDNFGLTLLNDISDPTFALIKDGKKVNEFIYGKDTKPMFQSVTGLRKAVSKIAKDPQYFYVDIDYLDHALFESKEDVIIYYLWSFCPDCNDCLPNVMTPYSEKNDFSHTVWLVDLAIPGCLLNDEGQWEGTGIQTYVDFLHEHKMSSYEGNEKFGYDRGFVPTTQVWKDGELKDMTVYFNDGIEKNDAGKYIITRSYYSEDRIKDLSYTNEILEGKEIPAEQIDVEVDAETGVEKYSWKADYARLYHKPILESFFNKYVK